MGDWTPGTVPTFTVGKLYADDMDTMADIATAQTSAWTTWVPTLANLTLGSGTVDAQYMRVGNTVDYRFSFLLGAGSAVGTAPSFTLPATPNADYVDAGFKAFPVGASYIYDASGGTYVGLVFVLATSAATIVYSTEVGAGSVNNITATAPITFVATDKIFAYGRFETS